MAGVGTRSALLNYIMYRSETREHEIDGIERIVLLDFIHRLVSQKTNKIEELKFLRHQTMDKVQKHNSFNTNTPSSESYRNHL
jgi:hypothetical protein